MSTLIIQAENEKLKAIVALLKAFDVSFEIKQEEEQPYDEEFVKEVLKRRKSALEGNLVEYTDKLRNEMFGK